MATDADSSAGDDFHAENDAAHPHSCEADSLAEPVDRSVAGTRESAYLARITVLQLRVSELESELAEREQALQSVRDRYEEVIDGPVTYPGDPLDDLEPLGNGRPDGGTRATDAERTVGGRRTDGGRRVATGRGSGTGSAVLDRLRGVVGRLRGLFDR